MVILGVIDDHMRKTLLEEPLGSTMICRFRTAIANGKELQGNLRGMSCSTLSL